MSVSRTIVIVGISAIPLWYAYRTLEEKRVRRLEWSEVFMTEPDRQKKWAEEKQKAKEAAEAERVQRQTELEKSTAARKTAEAEQDKAQAALAEKRTAEMAESNRTIIEAARRAESQEAIRQKAEAERSAKQQIIATALKACEEKAKSAEAKRQDLVAAAKSYKAFVDRASTLPISEIKFPGFADRGDYITTFRMLSTARLAASNDGNYLEESRKKCVAKASDSNATPFEVSSEIEGLEIIGNLFVGEKSQLEWSRADITDLMDYVTGKLPDTVGGQVRRARVKGFYDRAYSWKDSQ